jgi:spermidine synthase
MRRGARPRLLLWYGLLETAIGIYALLFPLLFAAIQAISFRLPHSSDGVSFAIDVCLTSVLIGPPTVLMGGTIPMLTQGLSRSLADATRFHSLVYAFNTSGAFVGALAAGFLLVPWLGLATTVASMGGVNLIAGLGFFLLHTREAAAAPGEAPPAPVAVSHSAEAAAPPKGFFAFCVVVLLAGFAMMTLQTVLNRIGAFALKIATT